MNQLTPYTFFNLLVVILLLSGITLPMSGCQTSNPIPTGFLGPGDLTKTPYFFDPTKRFGRIFMGDFVVPATCNIFLAGAKDGSEMIWYPSEQMDVAPENSPVDVLKGIIFGRETLDIYALGEVVLQGRKVGPRGMNKQETEDIGPEFKLKSVEGHLGSLVGMFNNSRQPFVIGKRRYIEVPRGAEFLYLGVLDYTGGSSNNLGQFRVTISVIRR